MIAVSYKIAYVVDLNVDFSVKRTAEPVDGFQAELMAQRVLVCQISVAKQLFRGRGWAEEGWSTPSRLL